MRCQTQNVDIEFGTVMQTLLRTVSGESQGWLVGCLLLAIMALYAAALCYSAFRRVYFDWCQQALGRNLLLTEIRTAKLKCLEAEHAKQTWNGFRKFEVAKKILECEGVTSLYLKPHDKAPLPLYKPGQYITFQISLPGQQKAAIRCYSLSDSHRPGHYRVTIKKALPPPGVNCKAGLVSSHFYDVVKEGDILDVKAPSGHFYLDLAESRPVVLISAGVGVTPMVSMLNALIDSGSKAEVWFFFGVRNKADHIFKEELEKAAAAHENVRMHVCYSRPDKTDVAGRDYQHEGRVTIELLKEKLPSNNYDYYLCGPGPFMNSITDGLMEWGVPKNSIHYEAFGPATVKKTAAPLTESETVVLSRLKVTFSRAGKTAGWTPSTTSLLDFAEANGIKIDAGCRAGNCGTCLVAIKSGSVDYLGDFGASAESGSCLTCVCKPKTDLVIDA